MKKQRKRNKQDATLININALKKRVDSDFRFWDLVISAIHKRLTVLEENQKRMRKAVRGRK